VPPRYYKYPIGSVLIVPILNHGLGENTFTKRPAAVVASLSTNSPDQLVVPLGTQHGDLNEYSIAHGLEDISIIDTKIPIPPGICKFQNIQIIDIRTLGADDSSLVGFLNQPKQDEIIKKVKALIGV